MAWSTLRARTQKRIRETGEWPPVRHTGTKLIGGNNGGRWDMYLEDLAGRKSLAITAALEALTSKELLEFQEPRGDHLMNPLSVFHRDEIDQENMESYWARNDYKLSWDEDDEPDYGSGDEELDRDIIALTDRGVAVLEEIHMDPVTLVGQHHGAQAGVVVGDNDDIYGRRNALEWVAVLQGA